MDSILKQLEGLDVKTVVVVDQRPDDYADLLSATQGADVRWQFVSNGREALHLAHTLPVDLWVVNDYLPDMSGLELCALLKSCLDQSVIYMVTDKYSQAIERDARNCGVALFVCKPVQQEWIIHFKTRQNGKHYMAKNPNRQATDASTQ
jgi:DNA-binding response OmpR family regulator